MLRQFYDPFERLLEKKDKEITRDDLIKETTDEQCPKCEGPMMIKLGRYGKFLSCANYPECKGTRQIDGTERPEPTPVEGECELCGSPLLLRHGRFGPFIGCSELPEVQVHQEGDDRRLVPEVPHGQAAAAPVEEAEVHVLRLHAISRLRLRDGGASAGRSVPEVRRHDGPGRGARRHLPVVRPRPPGRRRPAAGCTRAGSFIKLTR